MLEKDSLTVLKHAIAQLEKGFEGLPEFQKLNSVN